MYFPRTACSSMLELRRWASAASKVIPTRQFFVSRQRASSKAIMDSSTLPCHLGSSQSSFVAQAA